MEGSRSGVAEGKELPICSCGWQKATTVQGLENTSGKEEVLGGGSAGLPH